MSDLNSFCSSFNSLISLQINSNLTSVGDCLGMAYLPAFNSRDDLLNIVVLYIKSYHSFNNYLAVAGIEPLVVDVVKGCSANAM